MNRGVILAVVLLFGADANADWDQNRLTIPDVEDAAKRIITIDDVMAIRNIDTVSVSPDGRRFAIFVRQGDPLTNQYRTGWFVGSTPGEGLTYVGAGGHVGPGVHQNGQESGDIVGSESQWSPDGQWIAYAFERDGEVQLWRSRVDGSAQEQITHNAADVREFSWSDDGRALYFTVGISRAKRRAAQDVKARGGYQYDEDLNTFADFMQSQMRSSLETGSSLWVVTLDDRNEQLGSEQQRAAFNRDRARQIGGSETAAGFYDDAVVPPVMRADGASAWLVRSNPFSRILRVTASLSSDGSNPVTCTAEECSGVIKKLWWSEDGQYVFFWRTEGINDSAQGLYAWSPSTTKTSRIVRLLDDDLDLCTRAQGDRLICVRETPTRPPHLVSINLQTGSLTVLADVNPEFHNIGLGRVELFEWDTPKLAWNEVSGQLAGLYPKRAYGYILYPLDFDPAKKYPVFIDPYIAHGFRALGNEHALHVYAANGFVVLRTAFPLATDVLARLGKSAISQLYSAELDFPHLTMLMESTVRGLDVVSARGFIDEHRVGIGGVSHGTFVPLFMLQKHDRIAAISISSPNWGAFQYYLPTRKLREAIAASFGSAGYEDWVVKPEGKGREFWSRIDIADHTDAIEAPILMHLADRETVALLRLIRNLEDGRKPYDAYVFPKETHIKWQPSHLYSIMCRNLDWFRFWLQDYEDPAPAKTEQYSRWRKLRQQHEANRAPEYEGSK